MRRSMQRDLILDIVNISRDHLTVDEIYSIAKKTISNISLGTVYRNLNQLVDANLVLRIKTNEGLDRFDNVLIKHHHFICENCNKIVDIFDDFNLNMPLKNGSIISDYEIKFRGICNECKKEED